MSAIVDFDLPVSSAHWRQPVRGTPLADSPRMLLVDSQELVRVGVKTLYAQLEGRPLNWLEAESLDEALAIYSREGDVDGVLLDLNLPDCKGLRGLQIFRSAHPNARIAAFSSSQDEFVVRQARSLGATGFIYKGLTTSAMGEALTALAWPNGGPQSRGATSANVLFPRVIPSLAFERVGQLGARHLEILELLLCGCTNQEIGHATQLSLGTIKNYVSSLLLALDVKSRAHLISLFQ